jgi:CRISPR-associated Csx3 family protein
MIIIEVVLAAGLISPTDLPNLVKKVEEAVNPASVGQRVVCLSGRLPVWAFAALTHLYHPTKGVATFDPRLGGGVVVASHDPSGPTLGDVIPEEGAEKVTITF